MGRLVLFLPVFLIILAGNSKGDAISEDGPDKHIIPHQETAEVSLDRDTRGAGKQLDDQNNKPKQKKNNPGRHRNKGKVARRQRKHKRKPGRKSGNKNRPGSGRRHKSKRKQATRRCSKKKTKKARRRCMKKKKKDAKRKRHRHKKQKPGGRQGGAAGGDWSSCGIDKVNDTCITNAVTSLQFASNQIMNFMKQKSRMMGQNKTVGNKMGKKDKFNQSAYHLLTALGGNISNPKCGESNSTRSMSTAMELFATLMNCSARIHEMCDMPPKMMNMTFLDNCETIYKLSKFASDDCMNNTAYVTNSSAACNCWEKAAIGIVKAKEDGCTKYASDTAVSMRNMKAGCKKAFSVCKKAEDESIGMIWTCQTDMMDYSPIIHTMDSKGSG